MQLSICLSSAVRLFVEWTVLRVSECRVAPLPRSVACRGSDINLSEPALSTVGCVGGYV